MQLPTATPIASVDVQPMPGWTHTEKTSKLAKPITTDDGDITEAVSQITWTARAAAADQAGGVRQFTIIAGQLPDASSLTFKALQTYSDGTVVRWIEMAAPGSSAEPEHPAPVLTLAADVRRVAADRRVRRRRRRLVQQHRAGRAVDRRAGAGRGALGLAVVTRARRST